MGHKSLRVIRSDRITQDFAALGFSDLPLCGLDRLLLRCFFRRVPGVQTLASNLHDKREQMNLFRRKETKKSDFEIEEEDEEQGIL